MQVEIFDHKDGTVTQIHTRSNTRLAHRLHRPGSSPATFKVEPHSVVAPVCTSGGAAAEGRRPLLLIIIILGPIINPISLRL